VFRFLSAIVVACLALPALAQDLPTLRDARGIVFAEDGAVSWEVIADPALTEADIATLDQINQVQPQPYYAALAWRRMRGSPRRFTALAANYHDEENARAAALAACEANRGGAGAPCIVALVIRPEGWEPGRPLQLSAQATAALAERIPRASPPLPRDGDLAHDTGAGAWARGRRPRSRPAARPIAPRSSRVRTRID
jgi:hypothetical protein